MSISGPAPEQHLAAPPASTEGAVALLDVLTGVASRRGLERAISALPRIGRPRVMAAVACSLNRLRWVNEALGYEAGDDLLRLVARRLVDAAPDGLVGRVGGDEFMLVFPALPSDSDVEARIAQLDRGLRAPLTLHGRVVYPTATFGSASSTWPGSGSEVPTAGLMSLAEADMHGSKAARRWRPRAGLPADLLRLDTDLHLAVEHGDVIAHFQPLYDLPTGRLAGFEALARWHSPTLGRIAPDVFVPLAEDNGLIHAIGEQMLRAAQQFLAADDDPLHRVYVNVSAKQLAVPGFADRVAAIFDSDVTALRRTVLEVTESELIADHATVGQELAALRGLGAGIAVDDFGSGYSSLAQLQGVPATELKIDRTLVQQAGGTGHAVLKAVMGLAEGLGLPVVAEGVEAPEQLEVLRRLGCHRVQGFLFAPALPAEQARAVPESIDAALRARSRP